MARPSRAGYPQSPGNGAARAGCHRLLPSNGVTGGPGLERRRLGHTDLHASLVGLGCNNFGTRCDLPQARAVVHRALDLGITLFDTADRYGGRGGSEEYLGKALGRRGRDALVATKFGKPMGEGDLSGGASRGYIQRAVEASLRRLNRDTIDLYQLHLPDPDTPIEETLLALDDLVREGKIRAYGCSKFSGAQIREAQRSARARRIPGFATAQNHYSLLRREIEADVVPVCEEHDVSILPYFPLASGLLTGKYSRGEPPPADARLARTEPGEGLTLSDAAFERVGALDAIARRHGHTLLELAMSWLASRRVIASIIAGAMTPDQVTENAAAAGWKIDAPTLAAIDAVPS